MTYTQEKNMLFENEPLHEKTNNLHFRPGPTQTGENSLRK